MTDILICVPMQDEQSGKYIYDSLIELGNRVAFFDWRHITNERGIQGMNDLLVEVVGKLKPQLTLIVKGLGITPDTIRKVRQFHPHYIAGWIFDVTLNGAYLKDVRSYVDLIKEFDIFYTIDNDAVPELTNLGVNCKWLSEGCHIPSHDEAVFNSIQKRKYGADIAFIGGVGGIHKNREKLLQRLHNEGFYYKVYGEVYYPEGTEPEWVKDHHSGYAVANDYHSLVCNSSKIIIGIDGWPHRDRSWSARLYRVLCAGSFYLTTNTKGIDYYFKPGVHLDIFNNEDEMVEKVIKYLSDDNLRGQIAKAGQKEVKDKHQFIHRLQEIIGEMERVLSVSSKTENFK